MPSKIGLQKGDRVYYARAIDYDCLPLTVKNINDKLKYFTAIEISRKNHSGITFLFNFDDFNKVVFDNLYDAKEAVEIMRNMHEE